MEYRGYLIEEDPTGYAPKNMKFSFFLDDGETYVESGESIEDCKQQINELTKTIQKTRKYKVILLKDKNVKYYESNSQSKLRCFLMGVIWKYIPDLTYNKRRYLIVDA